MSELMDELKGDSCLNYGKSLHESTACSLCMSPKHNEINLLRVKKHMTYNEIAQTLNVSEKLVRTHFDNHFIANVATRRLLNLKENTSQEAMEIVTHILEGNFDFSTSMDLVLKSKADRLIDVKTRLTEMRNVRESASMRDPDAEDDTLAFCKLNKVAEDLEKSIIEINKTKQEFLFPMDQAQISNAMLSFKLSILQSMLDRIITVFIECENDFPSYAPVIADLKLRLAAQFNAIEADVAKSGGKLISNGSIETEGEVVEEDGEQ